MADANLQDRDAVRDVVMVDKVTRRTLNHGDRTSLHEVTIKQGGVVPLHDHPHEQIGYLASGRVLFTIGKLQREIKQGRLLGHPWRPAARGYGARGFRSH